MLTKKTIHIIPYVFSDWTRCALGEYSTLNGMFYDFAKYLIFKVLFGHKLLKNTVIFEAKISFLIA